MKTKNIIIAIVGIFLISIVIAIFIFFKNKDYKYSSVDDDCTKEEYMYEMGMFENGVEASSAETKISPNAKFIIEKYYTKCGHSIKEEKELPENMVNKTQEEIESEYKDYSVETFSSDEIVLEKNINGECDEHYKIKEEDGVIVIYNTNEKGEEVLYDKTGVAVQYLEKEDVDRIIQGITIYGKENLNKFIEDFE